MYAKLVLSAGVAPSLCIRDIINLCTSANPSVANLVGYSSTSSVVIDATPAGWTYVHSNVDGPTFSSSATASTGVGDWWAMSAPCLGPGASMLKYAKLTCTYLGNSTAGNNQAFCLSGATNIAGTTVTNEGYKFVTGIVANEAHALNSGVRCLAGTYYIVATPRHISIFGVTFTSCLWETSVTEVHEFYNIMPVIQFHETISTPSASAVASGNVGTVCITANTTGGTVHNTSQVAPGANGLGSIHHNYNIFNYTNPTTGVNFGTLNFGHMAQFTSNTSWGGAGNILCIQPYLMKHTASDKSVTIGSTGENRNSISPIFFGGPSIGLPTTYVTGICDIYSARSSAGTTGDTMIINGVTYTYIQGAARGFAVLTS